MAALALLFYLASILFGLTSVNYFFGRRIKAIIPKYAMAVPIGYVLATYLVLAQEIFWTVYSSLELAVASAAMVAIAVLLYKFAADRDMFSWKKLKAEVKSDPWYHTFLFIAIASLIILQMAGLHRSSAGIVAGDNYGPDFLFHVGIGTSLIYSGWPPTLLYAYNATNVFPFITDFYSAILITSGVGLQWSTWLMNSLLWFSLATLTVYFISLFIKNKSLAVAGLPLFLFVSLGFNMLIVGAFNINLWIFPPGTLANLKSNLLSLVTYPFFNFSDPMVSNFAIQHDYLLGFPFALTVMIMVYLVFFEHGRGKGKPKAPPFAEMAFLGMLAGLMPLVHPISFIFVFIFALTAFLYSFWATRAWKGGAGLQAFAYSWIPFVIVALIFALPEVAYIHSQHLQSGFFSWAYTQSFWYISGGLAAIPYDVWLHLVFWLEAIGLLFVVGLAGLYFFRNRIIVFIPSFIAFLMINIVQLQPSFGDSNKLNIYFLLFLTIAALQLFYEIGKRNKLLISVPVLLFFLITFSGILSEYFVFSYYNVIANVPIAASEWIAHNTPVNSVFLSNCVDNTFGFISTLGGRRTVLEYYYYIHDVGIFNYNPDAVYSQVASYYADPTCSMIKEYNVSYVAIENLSYFAPSWCFNVNYNAFTNPNFTVVNAFVNSSAGDSVYILKPTSCG